MNEKDLYEKMPGEAKSSRPIISAGSPTVTADMFLDKMPPIVSWRADFLVWSNIVYVPRESDMVRSITARWMEGCDTPHPKEKDKVVKFYPKIGDINQVMEAIRNKRIVPSEIELGGAIHGKGRDDRMVFRNGRLDLKTGEFGPHDPKYLVTNFIDFDYDKSLPEPSTWLRFLDEVFPDDPVSIATLQEIMGYLFSGKTNLQKIFLMIGKKRSGKGTIVKVIQHVLGKHNCCGIAFRKLSEQFGLQSSIGKTLIVVPDMRIGPRTDASVATENLLMISGEDLITIDRKKRPDWEGKHGARFMIVSNDTPKLYDPTGVIATRFVPLYCRQSFYGREDVDLIDKLLPEAAAILNWSLTGLERLLTRGQFIIPESAEELLEEVQMSGQPETVCFDDCFQVGPDLQMVKDRAYLTYTLWCSENGCKPCNSIEFGKRLKRYFPEVTESRPSTTLHGRRPRYWNGIGLLAPAQEEIDDQRYGRR